MPQTFDPRRNTYPGHVLRDTSAWLQRHPWQADSALAIVLFAYSTSQGGALAAISLGLAAGVVVRRRYPVTAFAAVAALAMVQVILGLGPSMTDLAIIVVLYTLAASRPRRISVTGLAACLLIAIGAIAPWAGAYRAPLDAVIAGTAGLVVAAWLLGDSAAVRRAYYAALEERAGRLEAERDAQARIEAAAERARELEEKR